jgi:hypothetical protein
LTASEAGISVVPVHVPQDLYMQIRTYPPPSGGGFSFQPSANDSPAHPPRGERFVSSVG